LDSERCTWKYSPPRAESCTSDALNFMACSIRSCSIDSSLRCPRCKIAGVILMQSRLEHVIFIDIGDDKACIAISAGHKVFKITAWQSSAYRCFGSLLVFWRFHSITALWLRSLAVNAAVSISCTATFSLIAIFAATPAA